MNFKLHQAICAANYAVGQMMGVDFSATHHMKDSENAGLAQARQYLMDALDGLSSYQAAAEAKRKVSA